RAMKLVDLCTAAGAKCHMDARRAGRALVDPEFSSRVVCAIGGANAKAHTSSQRFARHIAQGRERTQIKGPAALEVAHVNFDMVQHVSLLRKDGHHGPGKSA